jgi:antitoxin ParD1/3/4
MEVVNITLPENLTEFVVTRVSERGYPNASEYVGDLIRADLKQARFAALEAEIVKGLESGPAVPMTDEDWREIRAEVRRRHESRNSSPT